MSVGVPVEITEVSVRILHAQPTERIAMSFASMARRSMALVRVAASDGTVGYGESWINYPAWAATERRATIEQGVAPLLLGQPADDVRALHRRLVAELMPLGRQWGAPGPVCQAISGVDIALWDRLGRARGRPVADLLSEGTRRPSVPVYASSLGPTDVAAKATECRRAGFGLVKLKVGFGRDVDEANLLAAREALGDDVDLAVDANQGWSLADAIDFAPLLEAARVVWVEEPIADNSLADLEEFHRRTGLRIATGENLYLAPAFDPYIESPAIEVLQPDVTKAGGITELFEICQRASRADKTVLPHLYSGAVAFGATLQLAAASSSIACVEYDVRSNPLRDPLIADAPQQSGGLLRIPFGPGLGIELDLDAVEHFAAR